MNRFYLIVPVLLLAIFGGIYWQYTNSAAAHAAEKAQAVAAEQKVEADKKAEAERQARADAEKRTAIRLAEEQKKDAEKRARHEEESRVIAADTARYTEQLKTLTAEAAAMEKKLAELRAKRERLNAESFSLARDVELMRIDKRNAELEIQRLTEMVARQAGNTTLARPVNIERK
ncbi:MAG: hypothetical protein ABW223_10500 [Rariglobus sp.]